MSEVADTFDQYKKAVATLGFGKILPDALYLHSSLVGDLPELLRSLVERVAPKTEEFNVLKFSKRDLKISFLLYRDFFETAHPILVDAYAVNLATGKSRRIGYANHANPPILHRKELLLPIDHPRRAEYQTLTQQEEEFGLYANRKTIGFLLNWEKLLAEKQLRILGHRLEKVRADGAVKTQAEPVIERHKTAIVRYELSRPMKLALENGIISKSTEIFDFGCGLGTDVEGLKALGYSAHGWDPVHRPDTEKRRSDVVNLGFVLNVIEDPVERVDTLLSAWGLTAEALIVSCMVASQAQYGSFRPYKDGVLTQRNTFQKYYEQRELQGLLEEALKVDAIALSVGVFVCFRNVKIQQDFLVRRNRKVINWAQIRAHLPFEKRVRKSAIEALYEQNKELIECYFAEYIERGRLPIRGEFGEFEALEMRGLTPAKLLRIFKHRYQEDVLVEAETRRKDELLVYFAMATFERKLSLAELPASTVADIRAFFGSLKKLEASAKELLFSVGSPKVVENEADRLSFGYRHEDHITFHVDLYESLPASLKIYVQCGLKLAGGLTEYDLIKLHLRSSKVSFMRYRDFDKAPLPELQLRLKVDLRRTEARIFDYGGRGEAHLLIDKERYMPPDTTASRASQQAAKLIKEIGSDELLVYGPTKTQFLKILQLKGVSPTVFFPLDDSPDATPR